MADDEHGMDRATLELDGLDSDASAAQQRAALTALFQAEFGRLYGYLLARSGSRSIAEDVAAETFAEAARAVKSGDASALSPPWLFTVAKRRLIDHWRKAERHRKRTERLRMERIDETEWPVSDSIDDERILTALASLPVRQRAALTMRYLDEYSVSEVAETLEVSYKSAESLLSRGRAGFAAALEGDTNA